MILYFGMDERPLFIAVVTLFTFAVSLYTILCNWLDYGGMSKLTAWRGEKWVKELDYLYIFFGAVGLFWLLNGHPLTRAKIGGWNKSPPNQREPAR